jgi:GNAT superfamily N-acetyltransferase
MVDCDIIEMLPTPADYNHLRESVGWGTYEPAVIQTALPNSLYCVGAVLNGQVIGMARVVGDGGLVYYIQDVIVLPEYQRQGIGTLLMNAVLTYLRNHVSPNSVVGLMAAKGKELFYGKYGFYARPTADLGSGMTTNYQAVQSYFTTNANIYQP